MTLIIPKLVLSSSENEEKRLEELQSLRLLDPSSDGRFDRYTELAARALKTPMAAIILVDRETLCFKSARGLPREIPPQNVSFAGHVLSSKGTLVVADATLDPRFALHPIVRGEPYVRFYAGAAIRGRSGLPLGAICVADRVVREFSDEETGVLLEFGHLLEHEIQTYATVQELNDRVSREALRDPSTGLPNEPFFLEQLAELLSLRRDKPLVLALVRLNRLEQVHKALGKIGADYIVNQAVMRLRQASGVGSLLGHPREDLIAVAFPVRRASLVNAAVEKLLMCFHEPFVLGEHKLPTRVGIGVATSPGDAEEATVLLKRARTALDSDSDNNKSLISQYRFYNRQLSAQAVRRFQIESALGQAAAHNELTTVYQPKIRCSDRGVAGAEALLRWTNETLGPVSPSEFVPIAEESGQIAELGAWVLAQVCKQVVEWTHAGYCCPEVSINVAGDQLTLPGFSSRIRAILQRTSLEGDRLNLEVTEGSLIGNMENALQVMGELRRLGVRFSIDDFGEGFSSLSYLRQMPVQVLKIDRKFVEHVPKRRGEARLLKSIIGMGHALGLQVVAEGVETEEQWRFLCSEGCDLVQGFLFARPMPADEFVAAFLTQDTRLTSRGSAVRRPVIERT